MTMNCKECEMINNYPCVDYGICPQVDELEEIKSKIEACEVKHCSSTRTARHARHARMAREARKNYYLDETKFCLTVTNFCFAKCGNRIKIGERLPQVHIKMTREQPLQIKSGRGCESCAYFDWWNGECMKDDECKKR